ncbi:ABC transporter substrate-binding protein [Terribacillus sp. AE2B 122]|uniref:ABC transporter substrate-binding protein n=1 Tax=Terribacillus sp. AE2B 122 TaxID=1331902 RepID=UPI00144060C9|nr:ABC transporter substrate-binding protein [Terribacillus sp. AE2B 122]VVM35407.1 Glycerol-3-phosphate ABC transporter2C periplasmic glycerol-3-phosphate-binding protein (TC 3.A.1.1.3) [Terribacillus sp. AE2B 122]
MKKVISVLSLFLVLFLAACNNSSGANANGSDADGPAEVEFWHAMSGPHEEAIKKFADDFNSTHDDITIKPVNQGSYEDLQQKIMAAAKAGNLPDMAQATTNVIPEYIDNKFITSLNDFIEDPEVGLSEDELNDYIEVFRDSSTWDDTYYSLPFSKSTRVLFYNQTLLEENGLEAPKTWDELQEVAKTVTKDGVVGMGFENSYEAEFQGILKQMGGTYMDEATGEPEFASKEGQEAMGMISGMIDEGIARTAGEDEYMSNPFGRGDVAMYIGSSAGIPHVGGAMEDGIEWSTAPIPTLDGEAATTFAGNDIVIFNQSEEAEQKAAWEFMKYLTSPEVTSEWSMLSGYLPIRQSALDTEEYQQFLEENPAYKAGTEQFDAGFFIARVPGGDAVRNIVLEEMDYILQGMKTVEEGLTEAQERAKAELQ